MRDGEARRVCRRKKQREKEKEERRREKEKDSPSRTQGARGESGRRETFGGGGSKATAR